MAEQKAVRGNMVPPGGPTTTTDAGQGQALLPDTFTLVKMSEMFMERSESNCIQLNTVSLGLGQSTGFVINNVGLGESLELWIEGSIQLPNSDTSNSKTVNLTPDFPFNMVSNLLVQFNGQTVIDSLSGYELLGIMAKRYKGTLIGAKRSFGSVFSQNDARVPSAVAYVRAGNTDTTLNSSEGNSLTGVTSVTVAANKTGQVNFGFYLRLPFTLRDDLLLGLIPMQNNSIYCNVSITTPSINVGASGPTSPIYGSDGKISLGTCSIQAKPTYNFWAIPVPNDPKLYAYLVSHSYMLLSQTNNPLSKTGAEALQYNLPNNYYLLGLILTIRDNNGALIDVASKVDNPYLSYNGTIRVDRRPIATRFARQTIYYEAVPSPLGQLLWDATDVSYLPNGTNTSKWLNMYLANNPQFVADIDSSVSVPGSFAVLREQLVPANVQII